ncbi:MAG: hypothetical protein HY360_22985 [Verrucomicrobia bacterium]|nr:hypothetical protein [Verrucomicrobiota bacterium]
MNRNALCVIVLAGSLGAGAADESKIIFAPLTAAPPKIDGALDDVCWQRAEVQDDFIPLADRPADRTTVRALHDASHLYLGVECDWRDEAALRKGVSAIVEKRPQALTFVGIEQFVNTHGVEWFLDPGATRTSHYQILANAAGQICGQYKMDWNPFPEKPAFAVRLSAKGWSAEFSFSAAALRQPALRLGDRWGFNLVRNDAIPVAIWKRVGPDFNAPAMFGLLILGNYQTWWRQSVEAAMFKRFDEIGLRMDFYQKINPQIAKMHAELLPRIQEIRKNPRYARIETRQDFIRSFEMQQKLSRLFGRLDDLCKTAEMTTERQK